MLRGTVKWFNNAKGFGFVIPDDGSGDVFVHYSAIAMEGYRTLKPGQRVAYEAENTPNGRHAVTLTPEEEPAPAPLGKTGGGTPDSLIAA